MNAHRIRIYVGSNILKLAEERRYVKAALDEMLVDTYVFEMDAGACPNPIQQTVFSEIEAADLYIGVFWKGYGAITVQEYEYARQLGKACLIYEKREDIEGKRAPELQALLERICQVEIGLTVRRFDTSKELRELIRRDVAQWQAYSIHESLVSRIPRKRSINVFLCHSTVDKQAVRKLYQRLRGNGIAAWLDEEDLLPGQDWQQEIPKVVRKSDVVIVCLSKGAINRRGYLQKEICLGRSG